MALGPDARAVVLGLLAAASTFAGIYAAAFGSVILVQSGYASAWISGAAWLAFVFAIAPALAAYLVVKIVARLLGGDERALFAAVGAGLGGALALGGTLVVNGLFLFVGWYLFPWSFAYAAMVLPGLLRERSVPASLVALQIGVATAVYAPWIVLTLYNAFDRSAEMAGMREGAGWMENFPSAIVISILYGAVIIAALGVIRFPNLGPRDGQPASSERAPMR
jgi:hypothetical protein